MPNPDRTPDEPAIPCVIYAAKSTADKHRSIPKQLEDGRRMAEENDWQIIGGRGVGEFWDEGFSAYSGNRGPDLRRAEAAAIKAAEEWGTTCMLVVQHSDRLSRGAGDKPGASDSLSEIWHRLRRSDVHIRSFQNDPMMSKPVLVAVAAEQAFEESERKSKAIKNGKRQRVTERGQTNGPLQFGYRFDDPEAAKKKRVHDPEAVGALRRLKVLLREGHNISDLSRWLNQNGYRTKRGHTFTPHRVRDILRNRYYTGRVKVPGDDEWIDGQHEPVFTDAEFAEIQDDLAKLSLAPEAAGGRKPLTVGLLTRVWKCAKCGKGIYQKKMRSGRRTGVCGHVRYGSGMCDAMPFEAPEVEEAVLAHLDSLFVDLDGLIATVNAKHDEERAGLERELADLMKQREALEKTIGKLEADYVAKVEAGDETAAGIASRQMAKFGDQRDDLGERIDSAAARLEEWSAGEEDPADEVLDWWSRLSAAVRGEIVNAETVAEANAALKRHFAAVYVDASEGGPIRLDFVLRDRPPGAPVVSSSVWVGVGDDDDYWPAIVNWDGDPVKPDGSHSCWRNP